MKNNNRKIKKKLLALSIIFVLLLSYSPVFNNLFINPNFSAIVEEDISIETGFNVYEGVPYWYSGTFYDDADFEFAWTTAEIQFEHLASGVAYDYAITDLDNSETEYPTNSSFQMVDGIHYKNGSLNAVDGNYHIFNSSYDKVIAEQPTDFTITNGSSTYTGDIEFIDGDYTTFYSEGGEYPATFSFTDDTIGDPADFTVVEDAGTVNVIGGIDGHRNVVELFDNLAGFDTRLIQFFSENRTNGIIEFWMRTDEAGHESYFSLWDSGIEVLRFAIRDDDFDYYDGAWYEILSPALDDTWYHIKIIFETSLDGLESLDQYTWRVFINSVEYGDYDFINNQAEVDWAVWSTIDLDATYYYYVDAIGYDWLDYLLGDNYNWNYYPATHDFEKYNVTESGNYYGSYSFEKDLVGVVPAGWTNVGGTTVVASGIGGHNKIIDMQGTGEEGVITNTFTDRTSGTVELWIRAEVANKYCGVVLRDEVPQNHGMILFWTDGTVVYHNGGGWVQVGALTYLADTWYHWRIDFDCATDYLALWHNGVEYTITDSDDIEDINEVRLVVQDGNECYFDAIGFSWDPSYCQVEDTWNFDNDYKSWNKNPYNLSSMFPDNWDYYGVLGGTYSIDGEFANHKKYLEIYDDSDTDYYKGTYSFEGDLVGETDTDIGFVDVISSGDIDVEIIGEFQDHKKVLVADVPTDDAQYFYNSFSSQTSGIVEWWYATANKLSWNQNYMYEDGTSITNVGISNADFYYEDDGGINFFGVAENNVWYHFKVVLYADNTYDLYVDGVLGADGVNTINNMLSGINKFQHSRPSGTYNAYYDGVGYSWDGNYISDIYTYSDNLIEIGTQVWNTFDSQTDEILEFWINGDFDEYFRIYLMQDVNFATSIKVNGSELWYLNDGTWTLGDDTVSNNWQHIKIAFDTVADTYDLWLNSSLIDSDIPFQQTVTGIDRIMFETESGSPVTYKVDALGYSWDPNYDVGDNLIPTVLPVLEIEVNLNLDSFADLNKLYVVYAYLTDISLTCNFSVYNFDDSDYDVIENDINLAFVNSYFLSNSSHYNGTNDMILSFVISHPTLLFEMWLDRLLIRKPSYLNFSTTVNFETLINLLQMNINSYQRCNISQLINMSIWNYDTSSWIYLNGSSFITTFQLQHWTSNIFSNYIDSNRNVSLMYYGVNITDTFRFELDALSITLWRKTIVQYEETLYLLGVWGYRFVLDDGLGSSYNTTWIYFDVVVAIPNFYAISESDNPTRWILQGSDISPIEDFHDDINTDYWNLIDVSENSFKKSLTESSNYLLDNASILDEFQYTGINFNAEQCDNRPKGITWDGNYFWIVGDDEYRCGKYTSAGVYTGDKFVVWQETYNPKGIVFDGNYFWIVGDDYVLKYYAGGTFTDTGINMAGQVGEAYGITWDGTYLWVVGQQNEEVYKYDASGTYTGTHFDISGESVGSPPIWGGITWDGTHLWVLEATSSGTVDKVYKYETLSNISKNYFGSGYMYMQTNTTELISLKSIDYTTHYNLSSGGYFEIDFQTSSDSQIDLILLKDGLVNKTLTLSQSGNTNSDRHTVQISVGEFVEFDQLKISSTFEDTDNVKVYDIKTYKYEITGDYADFDVGSKGDYEVYLTPDIYNLRISENGYEKINVNITIPETGVLQYVYTPIETLECRLTLFNIGKENSLNFIDYHIDITRSLNGEWDDFDLLENIFTADVGSHVYINVSDRFDTLIDSFDKIASSYVDLELEVYQLQIKNLMTQKTTLDINATHVYPLLSGESEYFMLSKAYYKIGYYDEYNLYKNFTIYLSSNQAYQLNSSLKTIYFSMFTYDGLGIDHDLVRFYINSERKDLGFNSMLEDTLELVILDFFNNTLANETIDANAYDNSEYNLFVEIYSLVILNQFTYEDIIVNITQVGSGVWMTQIIPKQFGLTYRFLPNVEYNITIYFTNATLYDSRIVNLTSNSHIESFGVPTLPEEYPKDVYFGVYTTTGLGINRDLFRFYIDGNITDFGFNRIEDMIVTLVVKDYFNTTLFNQNINTSGIYEYNILITLFSLKVKNEARASANYTLKLGGLETTGFILPEEIIEYQLSSNNYVFDYTNNEDSSFHTININLNQDRVYVLSSTYYDTYFSLYDQNGVRLDDSLFSLYLNGTRKDFGFVELESADVLIVVQDYLNFTAFNSVITLSEFTEYNIIITVYELQIRHLAQENSNLIMYETTTHNCINFSMSPDSLNKYMLSNSTYNITWINGENGLSTIYDITLDENYILTLNTSYYNIFFNLYDLNLHIFHPYQYEFRLNGTIQDLGLIEGLQTDNYNITIIDRFGISLFNSIITLRGLNEYRINVTLYELQIRHLARENSNLTLTEDVSGNDYLFIMTPDSIKLMVVGSADYTLGWTNGETGLTTLISIALTEDRVVMLNTSYYNIYFSLFDLNLHSIDPKLYMFKLNGTIHDLGFIEDLSTDDYTITVADKFGTSLFDSVVNLRGVNEYRIDITLYELQIRHLAMENGNLTLSEIITHNNLNFSMSPNSLRSFILGSSTYNVTWLNNENYVSTTYDINLNSDYILTLNTTYYDIYFSLYDQGGVRLDDFLFSLYINTTRKDFGFVELESNNILIFVQDYLNVTVFNQVVGLSGYTEYNIIITVFELQIRHLAFENSDMILYETVTHNSLHFSMAPDTLNKYILANSIYNITWTNGENSLSTIYDITLNSDYILTLNSTYYNVYIGLYNFYGVVNTEEVKFYIDNVRADFGFNTIKTGSVTLTVLDYFNSTLFNQVVILEGLTEYSIFVRLYTLIINNLYNEKTITIQITRGSITIERLIEAQGWTEFKMFANTTYEINSYINGTIDEEMDVDLDEEYKTVDFGFYETKVPIIPLPQFVEALRQWSMVMLFILIFAVIALIVFYKLKMEDKKKEKRDLNGYVPSITKSPYF